MIFKKVVSIFTVATACVLCYSNNVCNAMEMEENLKLQYMAAKCEDGKCELDDGEKGSKLKEDGDSKKKEDGDSKKPELDNDGDKKEEL